MHQNTRRRMHAHHQKQHTKTKQYISASSNAFSCAYIAFQHILSHCISTDERRKRNVSGGKEKGKRQKTPHTPEQQPTRKERKDES
jgi:hypothetical protein